EARSAEPAGRHGARAGHTPEVAIRGQHRDQGLARLGGEPRRLDQHGSTALLDSEGTVPLQPEEKRAHSATTRTGVRSMGTIDSQNRVDSANTGTGAWARRR